MKRKEELLKEIKDILNSQKVGQWYSLNLQCKGQYYTIEILENALSKGELTAREALAIALIIGVQWDIKFGGTP